MVDLSLVMKTQPRSYQLSTFQKIKDLRYHAVLFEMGLGKSKVAIDNLCYLHTVNKIESAVIIVKKAVIKNWESGELKKHMWDSVNYQPYLWGKLNTKKEKEKLEYVHKFLGLKIYMVNIEAFQSNSKENMRKLKLIFDKINPHTSMVIIDEATDIKTHNSKRTKTINKFFDEVKYKRILTGTALAERPEDCYALYRFLSRDFWAKYGFLRFEQFRAYFCLFKEVVLPTHSFKKVIGYRNLNKLKEILLDPLTSTRYLQKDVEKELPDIVYKTYFTELSPEQKQHYKTMKEHLWAEINGKELELTAAVHKYMKLHQITSGVLHMEDGSEVIPGKNEKIDLLIDLIDQNLPHKTVVFSLLNSKPAIKLVVEALEKKFGESAVVAYTGDTPMEIRQDVINQFQDSNSPVKIFVGNCAAAMGITLTEANLQIYYSNTYSYNIREQSEKRCHRIGQKKTVTIIDLISEKTEDSRIVKALKEKQNVIDYVLNNKLTLV